MEASSDGWFALGRALSAIRTSVSAPHSCAFLSWPQHVEVRVAVFQTHEASAVASRTDEQVAAHLAVLDAAMQRHERVACRHAGRLELQVCKEMLAPPHVDPAYSRSLTHSFATRLGRREGVRGHRFVCSGDRDGAAQR